ncbi:MAG: DUF2341 domain-containing protein [Deltaproteobacteria bacterium]|nr:DUF2341 domain-containing protein [Deltaproteobacteria bacterium]
MGWLSGWGKRIKITIDHTKVDSALSNFPVLVHLSASSGIESDDVSCVFDELGSDSNRKKIAVTTSDGTTQCYVEIEKWDDANEEAWLHVKVPSVASGADTELYLYYDSDHADNTTYVGDTGDVAAQDVWDSNFEAVYHLSQDPSGGTDAIKDSTSNANHGTSTGSMTSGDLVDAKVDKGLDFDGSDDGVEIDDSSSLDISSALTLETIFKDTGTNDNWADWLCKEQCYLIGARSDSAIKNWFNVYIDGVWRGGAGEFNPSSDTWYYSAHTYDSSSKKLISYRDGVDIGSETLSGLATYLINTNSNNLGLSFNPTISGRHGKGVLDEVRISSTARSAAWIKATYHSLWDSLITFGTEESFQGWLSDWSKRIKLTISNENVDSDLSDFPVLIHLSTSSGTGSTDVSCVFDELGSDANRKKIAVTTSNGTTQCYVEVEKWDDANEEAWLWVKVPSVSSSADTDLYLYYDSSQADNTTYVGDTGDTAAQNVWDSNFKAVYHLAQDPSGGTDAIKDSTSNANHGTSTGSMTSDDLVDAKVGRGIELDGSDDLIEAADDTSLDVTGQLTLEAVFKSVATPSADEGIIAKYEGEGGLKSYRLVFTSNEKLKITLSDDGTTDVGHYVSFEADTAKSDNALHYAAATYIPSTSATIYLDGSQDGEQTSSVISSLYSSTAPLWLGAQDDETNSNLVFNGVLDEVRISSTARSAAWIKATYTSLWDDLIAFGTEESSNIECDISEAIALGDAWVGDSGVVECDISETIALGDAWVGDSGVVECDISETIALGDAFQLDSSYLDLTESTSLNASITVQRDLSQIEISEDIQISDAFGLYYDLSIEENLSQDDEFSIGREIEDSFQSLFILSDSFQAEIAKTANVEDGLFLYELAPKWGIAVDITDDITFTEIIEDVAAWEIMEVLTLADSDATVWHGKEAVESTAEWTGQVIPAWGKDVFDSIDMADGLGGTLTLIVQDAIGLTVSILENWQGTEALQGDIRLVDSGIVGWLKAVLETISLHDTLGQAFLSELEELLIIGAETQANWEGTETALSIIRLSSNLLVGWLIAVSETVDFADTEVEKLLLVIEDLFNLAASESVNWTGTEAVQSPITFRPQVGTEWAVLTAEAIGLADTLSPALGLFARDVVKLLEALITNWTGTRAVQSDLRAFVGQAIIQEIFNETATSSIEATDTTSYLHQMISVAVEELGLSGLLASNVDYNPTLTETVAVAGAVSVLANYFQLNQDAVNVADVAGFGWDGVAIESLGLADSLILVALCLNILTDSIEITEEVLQEFHVESELSDVLEFAASLALNQIATSSIVDRLNLNIMVQFGDDLWECWVLNTNAFHASVYSGFNFNSYAVYNNEAFGCKPDGIYKLSGDTDNGAAFVPGIVLPSTYFGTDRRKRFRKAYFGLIGGTTPGLKVETDSGSKIYSIVDSKANMTRDMVGRKWVLKFQDFESVSFINLVPVILAR